MPNTKKIPIGGLNTDDAEYLLDPKEYLGGLNIRFATTENGQVGKISNVEGTIEKTQTLNELGVHLIYLLAPTKQLARTKILLTEESFGLTGTLVDHMAFIVMILIQI